jgi:hypothetical protein
MWGVWSKVCSETSFKYTYEKSHGREAVWMWGVWSHVCSEILFTETYESHTGGKPYECEECGHKFAQWSVFIHTWNHTQEDIRIDE